MDSFLEGPWHWDWSGASRVWWREGLRSAAHSHLPCYWDGMTDQISWKVLGRRIRWSAHRTIVTLLFFPDFSPATAIRRKAFGPVLKKMTALGLQPFLIYQRWLSYGTKENREASIPSESGGFYQFPCLSRSPMPPLFGGTTGEQRPLFLRFDGRGVTAWMDLALAAQKGMIAGWPWMLLNLFFAVFFSYTGILSLFIRYNDLFAGRLTLHFSVLEGTNGE